MDQYEAIAPYYDCEHGHLTEDIEFYLNMVSDGPVLEVGAGTGRLMKALAEREIDVTGIEPSEAMLRRARQKVRDLTKAHLLRGSIVDLDVDARFSAIILSLNTLWHFLDTDLQLRAMNSVSRHLAGGGVVIIDTSNPFTLADRGARGDVRERFEGPCGENRVACHSSAWDDESEQTLALSLTYDETTEDGSIRRSHAALTLRYLYRYELELLLRLSGLDPRETYGSYDLLPYVPESPNLIMVAAAK